LRNRSRFARLGGRGAQGLGKAREDGAGPAKVRRRGERPVWTGLALLVAGAFFMENLDGTIIATAAPRMARSFGVPSVELNVVITAYLLALGVFIPVSGWIADRYGARLVFSGAIALFTVSSGLCALSTSLGELTAARVLQGLGGAMMVPVGRLVVLRAANKADIIRVIAYLTWPALVAPVVAPALGGALVTYASWRWIFVLNLPLGLVALLVAVRIVPNLRPGRPAGLDWGGFALTGAGLGTFVFGLELVTDGSVSWAAVGAAIGAGAVLIWWAVGHLRRTAHPLLDLRVLRVPTFRASSLGGSLFRMAISAAPFLLALMFQDGFGWSPLRSGVLVIAVFVGNIAIKPFTTPILHRFGFRTVLVTAGAAAGLTLALCASFTAGTPLLLIVLVLVVSGVFRSIGFTAYNTIVFADVAPEGMGNANTLSSTIQQLTMGLGVAVGALALRAGAPLDHLVGAASTGGGPFSAAFLLLAVVAFLAAAEAALLEHQAGSVIVVPRPDGGVS
jgi:EmrB/QacA subfamily drug resistance transporter